MTELSDADRIMWVPEGMIRDAPRSWIDSDQHSVRRFHVCPTAVIPTWTIRESLDPMALGTCRYCKTELP